MIKSGRTTGVTVGKVASVKTDVSSEGSKGFTSEITVASPAFMANTSFSYHGDSGGPVFGIEGKLVGRVLKACQRNMMDYATSVTLRPGNYSNQGSKS